MLPLSGSHALIWRVISGGIFLRKSSAICLTCHLAACRQVPGLIVSLMFVHMKMTLTLASLYHGFLALFRNQGWKFEVGDINKGRQWDP